MLSTSSSAAAAAAAFTKVLAFALPCAYFLAASFAFAFAARLKSVELNLQALLVLNPLDVSVTKVRAASAIVG